MEPLANLTPACILSKSCSAPKYTALCEEVRLKTRILIASAIFLAISQALAHGQNRKATSKTAVQEHIEAVESCLPPPVIVKGEPRSCTNLLKRMVELHVAGASIAVVHHGTLEWAKGYGVRQIGGDSVNADSLFQAGSISKPIAAMGTLRLVQERSRFPDLY
jgi:CubicO group peptidase (beta-lactamase class C family)